MPLNRRLVLDFAKAEVDGELRGGSNGAATPEVSLAAGRHLLAPQTRPSRPDQDQGPRNKDTPSLAVLLKSPWRIEYSTRSPKAPV